MKVSCEIIKDLLPLYKDELCSDESKKMIDEHLLECEKCKRELELMNEEINISEEIIKDNIKEAEELVSISKKWNKKLMFEILKGIGIGVLVMIVLVIFVWIFIGIKIG